MDLKSILGYSQGSPFANNPYLNIQGNNITMQNTDIPLLLQPMKKGKKFGKPKMGIPFDKNPYLFPSADSVMEIPLMQKGGISYEDWKKKYNLKESNDYRLQRAWELGYVPDNQGHLPSVDNQTLEFLKAPNHPSIKSELEWYNSPEAQGFKSKYDIDSTGLFWKYVPKMQSGGIYRKFWENYRTQMENDYQNIPRGKDDGFDAFYHHLRKDYPIVTSKLSGWEMINPKYPDNIIFSEGTQLNSEDVKRISQGTRLARFTEDHEVKNIEENEFDREFILKYLMPKYWDSENSKVKKSKLQKGGFSWMQPIPRPSSESTSMGVDVLRRNPELERKVANQRAIQESLEKQGQIKQAEPERSAKSKAWAIATHPMTALKYKLHGQDIPENFERGEVNPLEHAVNIVNPFAYGDIAASIPGNIRRGEYLQAGLNTASILPFAAEFRPQLKNITKTLIDIPRAESLKEAMGRVAGIPLKKDLPRMAAEDVKALRQVQEIGRLRATNVSMAEQMKYGLESNLPEEHFQKVFGRSREEAQDLLNKGFGQQEAARSADIRGRINLQRPSRGRDLDIDVTGITEEDISLALENVERQAQRDAMRARFRELDAAEEAATDGATESAGYVTGSYRPDYATDIARDPYQIRSDRVQDIVNRFSQPRPEYTGISPEAHERFQRAYNDLISSGRVSRTIIPGQESSRIPLSMQLKQDINLGVNKLSNKLEDFVGNVTQNYPFHSGEVLEKVPSLSLSGSGNLKEVSKKVSFAPEGIKSGDVFTGSTNTSHSSYLPQLKQVFKYTKGDPQFLGYRPMNTLGFLSGYGYEGKDIAKYLNSEIDEQIKRGILPKNIQRPFVKGEYVILPHYGVKQHKKGGLIKAQNGLYFNNLDEYTSFQKNLKTKREIPIMQKAGFFNPYGDPRDIARQNISRSDETKLFNIPVHPISSDRQVIKEAGEAKKIINTKELARRKKAISQSNSNNSFATSAAGDKLRLFPDDPNSIIDEYLNPLKMVGDMADNIGHTFTNPNAGTGEKVLSLATPLTMGAIGSLGAKTTGQFINNLFNPFAGASKVGFNAAKKEIGVAARLRAKQAAGEPLTTNYDNVIKSILDNPTELEAIRNNINLSDNDIIKLEKYLSETYDYNNLTPFQKKKLLDRETYYLKKNNVSVDQRIQNNENLLTQWENYKKDRTEYFNSPKFKERVNKQYGEMSDENFKDFKEGLLQNLEKRPYIRPDVIDENAAAHYKQEPTHKLGTDDHKYGHSYFKDKYASDPEVVFHEGRHQLTNAEDEFFFFPSRKEIQEGLVHPDLLKFDPDLTNPKTGADYFLSSPEFIVRLDELKRDMSKVGYDYKTMDLTPEIIKKYRGVSPKEAIFKVTGKPYGIKLNELTPEQHDAVIQLLDEVPEKTTDSQRLLRWFKDDFLLNQINIIIYIIK